MLTETELVLLKLRTHACSNPLHVLYSTQNTFTEYFQMTISQLKFISSKTAGF